MSTWCRHSSARNINFWQLDNYAKSSIRAENAESVLFWKSISPLSIEFDIARKQTIKKKTKQTNKQTKSIQCRKLLYSKARACLCNKDPKHYRQPLGRSCPFSPSDGMFCILRRCRISFALSEDRPPRRIAPSSRKKSTGKEGKEWREKEREDREREKRDTRDTRANPPLKSVVIHGPVLRAKKNTSRQC